MAKRIIVPALLLIAALTGVAPSNLHANASPVSDHAGVARAPDNLSSDSGREPPSPTNPNGPSI